MATIAKRPAIVGGVIFGSVIVAVSGYLVWDLRLKLPADALPPLPKEHTVLAFAGMDSAAWQRVIPVLQGLYEPILAELATLGIALTETHEELVA